MPARNASRLEVAPVAEFVRIDPAGKTTDELLVEIAHAVNKTHDCVHRGQAEQAARDQEAAEKRHQMANTIASTQGSVRSLFKRLGKLETTQGLDSTRIDKLAKMFGAEKAPKGQKPPKGRGIVGWSGWQMVGASSGILVIYKIVIPLLEPVFRAIHHAIMAVS